MLTEFKLQGEYSAQGMHCCYFTVLDALTRTSASIYVVPKGVVQWLSFSISLFFFSFFVLVWFVYFLTGAIYFEKEQWNRIRSHSDVNFISFHFLFPGMSQMGFKAAHFSQLISLHFSFHNCKIKSFNSMIPSKWVGIYCLSYRGFPVPG